MKKTYECLATTCLLCLLTIASLRAEDEVVLPANAKFSIGDSKAYQLLVKTQKAILVANNENVPMLTLKSDVLKKRAFDIAIRSLADTRIPANFLELEKARGVKAPAPALQLGGAPDPAATSFDWRSQGKVTPVRTYLNNTGQDGCGCCWCFAACATFEASHLLRYGGSAASIDASEQQIVNCGHTGACAGDWYYTAWKYMEHQGTATEHDVPYHAGVESCMTVATPFKVTNYGLVSTSHPIPKPAEVKKALCQFGPLAVAVYADEGFVRYKDGVYQPLPGTPGYGFPSTPDLPANEIQINHAVTLIGWDDTKSAWLIKNSWGNDWGSTGGTGTEHGYMWIDYSTNNIAFASAWVVAAM
jgi:C1A family cysteine protease